MYNPIAHEHPRDHCRRRGGTPFGLCAQGRRARRLRGGGTFRRVKQALGYFPSRSIRYCLKRAKLGLDDIDCIAFGWDANAYRWRFPLFLAKSFLKHRAWRHPRAPHASPGRPQLGSAVLSGIRSLVSFQPKALMEKIVLGLGDAGFKDGRIPPVSFIKHHLAHAASAHYCSGFDESAILVFDGHGEENTTTIFRGEGKRIRLLKEINIPHSLGWFYSAFTEFLGWNPNEGEVKLMGLAPFGKPNPEIEELVKRILMITDDGIRVNADYLFYGKRSYGKFFSDVLVDQLVPVQKHHNLWCTRGLSKMWVLYVFSRHLVGSEANENLGRNERRIVSNPWL